MCGLAKMRTVRRLTCLHSDPLWRFGLAVRTDEPDRPAQLSHACTTSLLRGESLLKFDLSLPVDSPHDLAATVGSVWSKVPSQVQGAFRVSNPDAGRVWDAAHS